MDMKPREWGTVTVVAFGVGILAGAAITDSLDLDFTFGWTALAAVGTVAAFFGVLYVHWSSGERQRRRDRQLAAPKATVIYRDIEKTLRRLEGLQARIAHELKNGDWGDVNRQGLLDIVREDRIPRMLEKFVGDIGAIDSRASTELAHVLADAYQLDEVINSIGTCFTGIGAEKTRAESKFLARLREAGVTLSSSIQRALPLLRPYTSLAPVLIFPETIKASIFGRVSVEVKKGPGLTEQP